MKRVEIGTWRRLADIDERFIGRVEICCRDRVVDVSCQAGE